MINFTSLPLITMATGHNNHELTNSTIKSLPGRYILSAAISSRTIKWICHVLHLYLDLWK